MPTLSKTAVACLLPVALIRMVPAPPLAAMADVGTAISSAASIDGALTSHSKRSERSTRVHRRDIKRSTQQKQVGNCNDWKTGVQQLGGHYISFQPGDSASDILVTGLPASCITWADGIAGTIHASNPVTVGDNAIKIEDLSAQDIEEVRDAIDKANKAVNHGLAAPSATSAATPQASKRALTESEFKDVEDGIAEALDVVSGGEQRSPSILTDIEDAVQGVLGVVDGESSSSTNSKRSPRNIVEEIGSAVKGVLGVVDDVQPSPTSQESKRSALHSITGNISSDIQNAIKGAIKAFGDAQPSPSAQA